MTSTAAAATVTCVRCHEEVAIDDADVVGLGHRCGRCSLAADLDELTGRPDVVDHLALRERMRLGAQGRRLAVRGAVGAAALAALAVVGFALAPAGLAVWLRVGLLAVMWLLGVGGLGLARWRRFRVDVPDQPGAPELARRSGRMA